MITQIGFGQSSLKSQLEKLVSDPPKLATHQTIKEAAQEYIVGRHLAARDQHGAALAHFRRSAELDKHAAAPWIGMAISLSAIGRPDTSIAAWKEVIERDPSNGNALFVLGINAAHIGDFETACSLLSQRWLQQLDTPVESLLRDSALISSLIATGKQDVAFLLQNEFDSVYKEASAELLAEATSSTWLAVLQKLIDVNATAVALQLVTDNALLAKPEERGILLTTLPVLEVAENGDGSKTKRIYEQAATEQGLQIYFGERNRISLAEAFSLAAQSMSVLGSVNAPILLYESSLALESDIPLVHNNLGWLRLLRDGPTDEVVSICLHAYELDSTAPYILDTVGWMYMLRGDIETSLKHLLAATRDAKKVSPETYDHLGDVYWKLGKKEDAVRAWETAASVLVSSENQQAAIDSYSSMAYSVWGISIATPEELYDLELGTVTRRLIKKLSAVEVGRDPLIEAAQIKNGVE
ncbi:MAG: tetratricopeptide repeat protein [Planctomycetota bacterium]|nr:tetratricopeptide repeat protein [Planctomycetota bacterium]